MAEEDKEPELTQQQNKAVDLLYEAMLFWHSEGIKIIKTLQLKLNMEGAGREAANIAKLWKDVDDRWIDIASKLAPYQSSKLSSIAVKREEIRRYVIEAPRIIPDKREWLNVVSEDQKHLPKPSIIENIANGDGTIDEAEYIDVNEY